MNGRVIWIRTGLSEVSPQKHCVFFSTCWVVLLLPKQHITESSLFIYSVLLSLPPVLWNCWFCIRNSTHTHTHTQPFYRFSGICPGPTRVSRYQEGKTRKVKTNLDLLEQEIVGGSGICWAICKSAPHPRKPRQHPTTQEQHPACKNWVMRCWYGYLSAYGPADATATRYVMLH